MITVDCYGHLKMVQDANIVKHHSATLGLYFPSYTLLTNDLWTVPDQHISQYTCTFLVTGCALDFARNRLCL